MQTQRKQSSNIDSSLMRRRRRELYEDPLQHLWAVSYSDLLMVLMAFFILFFKFTDFMKPGSPLDGILVALEQKGHFVKKGEVGNGGSGAGATGAPAAPQMTSLQSLLEQLQVNKVDVQPLKNRHSLLVNFADNFYREGEYRLSGAREKRVAKILSILKPFEKQISLTFIGHSDPIPLRHTAENEVIHSNLALSNLRADRAAEYTIQRGFDPSFVSSKGVGQYARHTRSLSLLISVRETP